MAEGTVIFTGIIETSVRLRERSRLLSATARQLVLAVGCWRGEAVLSVAAAA
jgi:hypothetical protein